MKKVWGILLFGSVASLWSCGGTDQAKVDEGSAVPDLVAEPDIPAPEPDIPSLVVPFETPEDLAEHCEGSELTSNWHEIVIPPNDTPCPWGEGDNAEMSQGELTARIEQVIPIELPEGTVLCDLTFDFSEGSDAGGKTLHYDDHFLLTLNGAVIISSRGSWVENFPEVMGLRMYDWSQILGESIGGSSQQSAYCLGEAEGLSQCTIPTTDEEGIIEIAIDQSLATKLSFLGFYAQAHAINFITTGDNDPDTDCNHTELTFRVLVKHTKLK